MKLKKSGAEGETEIQASGEEIKKPEAAGRQKKVTLIGEPVTMESLAAGIEQKYGCPVEVLCPLEKQKVCFADRTDGSVGKKRWKKH